MSRRLRVHLPRVGLDLATPLLWVGLRAGAVPNLTRESLEMFWPPTSPFHATPLLIPLDFLTRSADVMHELGQGVAAFVGMENHPTVVVPRDPTLPDRLGFGDKASVSIFSRGNRERVDPKRYLELLSRAKPDVWVALCDGETPVGSTKKRISKSVNKSLTFLDECLKLKNDENDPFPSLVFGAVEGGFCSASRRLSARSTAERPVDGFLLDGFHCNGPDSLQLDIDVVSRILREDVIPHLPDKKPRIFSGACDPRVVLELISCGVDMFDSTYPILAAENGAALSFVNRYEGGMSGQQEDLPSRHDAPKEDDVPDQQLPEQEFQLNLSAEYFKEDLSPLVSGCSCYACRKHTRAYVHHLLATKEMLAKVLLVGHNLHHYQVFFESIALAIDQDRLHDFKKKLLRQD